MFPKGRVNTLTPWSLNPFFIRSVCVSVRHYRRCGDVVLIPSSSGLSVFPGLFALIDEYGTVLIPSSSGLSVFLVVTSDVAPATQVLIPSSSGLSVFRHQCEYVIWGTVLIPSSSGLSVFPFIDAQPACWQSLNPFFIRSVCVSKVLIESGIAGVLIPSSSGLSVFQDNSDVSEALVLS